MNIDRFTVIQTWSTKKFHKNIESLRASMMGKNPEFKFLLFDDQELNNSIEEYFDKDVTALATSAGDIAGIENFKAYYGNYITGFSDGELILKNEPSEIKDCSKTFNKASFALNQGLDKAIFKPLAKGYRALPSPIRTGTGNVVSNLSNLITIPNNLLQGDFHSAGINTARLAVVGEDPLLLSGQDPNKVSRANKATSIAAKPAMERITRFDINWNLISWPCLLYTSDAADE